MNILCKCNIIRIDLNLPLYGEDIFDTYKKRMFIACDVAEKVPDYTSVVIMDHGIVIKTIESKRKQKEEILKTVEFIKEKFGEYFSKIEN